MRAVDNCSVLVTASSTPKWLPWSHASQESTAERPTVWVWVDVSMHVCLQTENCRETPFRDSTSPSPRRHFINTVTRGREPSSWAENIPHLLAEKEKSNHGRKLVKVRPSVLCWKSEREVDERCVWASVCVFGRVGRGHKGIQNRKRKKKLEKSAEEVKDRRGEPEMTEMDCSQQGREGGRRRGE